MTERDFPPRPLVGIGIAVLRRHPLPAVLLIRRARPPAQGEWALPGGAQNLGESAEEAARRELAEETGLQVGPLRLAGYVDSIHRTPDGQVRYHYTILDFCADWQGGEPHAGDDAADALWAPLAGLDAFRLWSEALRIIEAARIILQVG